jgi:hypothetical protein
MSSIRLFFLLDVLKILLMKQTIEIKKFLGVIMPLGDRKWEIIWQYNFL